MTAHPAGWPVLTSVDLCRPALTDLQVLCGSQELAEQLGPLLWPPVAAAYITVKLKPIQPASDAEVGARGALFTCSLLSRL